MKNNNLIKLGQLPLIWAMFLTLFHVTGSFAQVSKQSDQLLTSGNNIQIPFKVECPPVELKAKSLIHYRDYSKLYLRFKEIPNGQIVTLKSISGDGELKKEVNNLEVLFTNLLPGEEYQIVTEGLFCHEEVPVATVSTHAEDIQNTGQMAVSNEMYQVIREFQGLKERTDLIDYLELKKEISSYERTSFIQQFLLKGEPLLEDGSFNFSNTKNSTKSLCDCILLKNGFTYINNMWYGENGSQHLGDKANASWGQYQEGPAKYFNVVTAAWHDGGVFASEKSYTKDLTNSQEFHSQVGFTLFCYKKGWPYTCPCDKPVEVFYDYNSTVNSDVKIRTGWGNKKASGQAQDIAVVTLIRKNQNNPNNPDVVPLAAGDLGVDVSCSNGNLNGNFFKHIGDVATSIVGIIGGNYAQIPGLITGIGQVASTPIRENVSSCDNQNFTETLVGTGTTGTKTVRISSGDEVTLLLSSFSKIKTGGKRSWRSSMSITSNFYLVAIMGSDIGLGSSASCCTNKVGMWTSSVIDNRIDDVNALILQPEGFGTSPWNQGGWEALPDNPCIQLPVWPWLMVGNGENKESKLKSVDEIRLNKFRDESQLLEAERTIKISPNPVNDILNVSFNIDENMMGQLKIYDLTGRLVKIVKIEIADNYQLSVADLQPQSYVLKIEGENGFQVVEKFIKVK